MVDGGQLDQQAYLNQRQDKSTFTIVLSEGGHINDTELVVGAQQVLVVVNIFFGLDRRLLCSRPCVYGIKSPSDGGLYQHHKALP